jgi:hypothetical protein
MYTEVKKQEKKQLGTCNIEGTRGCTREGVGGVSPCLQDVYQSPNSDHLCRSYCWDEFRPWRDDPGHVSAFGGEILIACQQETILPAKSVYCSD